MGTKRVTDGDIDALAVEINRAVGAPDEPFAMDEGRNMRPNAGAYFIERSRGVERLAVMLEGGCSSFVCAPTMASNTNLYGIVEAFLLGARIPTTPPQSCAVSFPSLPCESRICTSFPV